LGFAGKDEFEFVEQEGEFGLGLGVGGQEQLAAVGGRELRGVRPGARACWRRPSVTCRQQARKAMKT
jgi:hypothetical protein